MKYFLILLLSSSTLLAHENFYNLWLAYTATDNFLEVVFLVIIITIGVISRHHILKNKNLELQKLQKELMELNQSLETKIEKAVLEIKEKDAHLLHQSRLAQMGEMLSMIAHQWKQPLASISTIHIAMKMAVELEKYDLTDKKQREDFLLFLDEKFDKLGVYVQSLSQIISDFSDFYRPNKNSHTLLLDSIIVKTCKLIEESVKGSGISTSLELNSKSKIDIHENEFMQVILNIINNSKEQIVQNSIVDGQIHIKSYDKGDKSYMEISDNAKGIDEAIIDKLFDPYFSTKLEKNGTGLGLYMSKVIVEDYHNGKIYAKNIDEGAMFVIELSRYKEGKSNV